MIFIFMAGSYAPFCFMPFRGPFECHEIFHILIMPGTGAYFRVAYWYMNPFS